MKSLQNATKLDFLYDMHGKTWQHYQGEKKGMYLVKDGRNMEWEVAEQGEKEKEKKTEEGKQKYKGGRKKTERIQKKKRNRNITWLYASSREETERR